MAMFARLLDWIRGKRPDDEHPGSEPVTFEQPLDSVMLDRGETSRQELASYDATLLERARTQWQFGDWDSLVKIDLDMLKNHPDRAKLALLAAAGHQQIGSLDETRKFTRMALDWGCNKGLVHRVLIAGVYNTLGRAAALAGQEQRTVHHFDSAIRLGMPGADARLLVRVRSEMQLTQIGMLEERHVLPDTEKWTAA